jgi:plasmid stability protein
MKKLQMNIPDEIHKKLKMYAAEHGMLMTDVVLKLLEDLFAKEDKKLKK